MYRGYLRKPDMPVAIRLLADHGSVYGPEGTPGNYRSGCTKKAVKTQLGEADISAGMAGMQME